jgi:membrane-associated protein
MLFDVTNLITTVGYVGVAAIVFAESGLFFGFFFPGDSLLFTAGLLAAQGYFSIWILTPLCFIAAVLGDSVGYAFGRKVGPAIFSREDSLLFHKKHLEQTRVAYEKYGSKIIVLARFMPVVRTFAPIMAGVGQMRYRTFLTYNLIGGGLWAIGLTLLGYFLGATVPGIDQYLMPIIAGIIIVSMLPPLWHVWRERRRCTTVNSR